VKRLVHQYHDFEDSIVASLQAASEAASVPALCALSDKLQCSPGNFICVTDLSLPDMCKQNLSQTNPQTRGCDVAHMGILLDLFVFSDNCSFNSDKDTCEKMNRLVLLFLVLMSSLHLYNCLPTQYAFLQLSLFLLEMLHGTRRFIL